MSRRKRRRVRGAGGGPLVGRPVCDVEKKYEKKYEKMNMYIYIK